MMTDHKVKGIIKYLPIFPICLGLGVGLGALIFNVGVGLGIGVAIGTTLSLAVEYALDRGY